MKGHHETAFFLNGLGIQTHGDQRSLMETEREDPEDLRSAYHHPWNECKAIKVVTFIVSLVF